jgi:hypothetical protein
VDQHQLKVSRPPGHPTTETYLLPAVAWLTRTSFNGEFDERIYLLCQAVAAIAAVAIFYRLLCHLELQQWKAVLASACLAMSPGFFGNAVDGEEFVFAVFFLTASVYPLFRQSRERPILRRLFPAIACFALATGCRPEVILAGFIIPLYVALHPQGGWRRMPAILFAEMFAVAIVWMPIVRIGVYWSYAAGMSVRESLLGGGYRLVFQCFTLPVFVLMCWVLLQSFRKWRQRAADHFPQNFIFLVSWLTPIVFFGALFLHASKPAHALFAVPFLLILAVGRSASLLITWSALTLVGCFVRVDIFKDRQLVRPRLVAGAYFQAIRQKPFYKLPYLLELLRHCGPGNTAVIGDFWRWDIDYHVAHHTFDAREQHWKDANGDEVIVFATNLCDLLPRDAALHPRGIEELKFRGQIASVKMDQRLYRTLFMRYNVTSSIPTEGRIGHVQVKLVAMVPPLE